MRRSRLLLVLAAGFAKPVLAQAPAPSQNATLRQALQAYDNVDFARAIALARRALLGRMSGPDQARAYELLGFAYSATDSQVKAVDATAGQNSFSASQPVRIVHGTVDTLPHLTSLPGYQELPETEIAPQSWRPVGLAFLYTGGALVGTLGLESASLGSSSKRELGIVGGAALVTGFVMMLRKPAARPAQGNILYNKLLHEQIARRNQDIAKENVTRRQQVQLTIAPLSKPSGAGR